MSYAYHHTVGSRSVPGNIGTGRTIIEHKLLNDEYYHLMIVAMVSYQIYKLEISVVYILKPTNYRGVTPLTLALRRQRKAISVSSKPAWSIE